jgi:photosystem II stability/assembly factor-like uncharacterized protein
MVELHTRVVRRRWLKRHTILALFILFSLLVLIVSACGDAGGSSPQPTVYGGTRVNGFGSAANHVHSLLVLPNNVQVLATHYGLFRSSDAGRTWLTVAGGPNQPMDGLMTASLTVSPFNPQRLYVLTQPALTDHKGTLGIYTSADQGKTWQMGASSDELRGLAYTVQAGNTSADEVYTYIPTRAAQGLMVSEDDGKHFTATGILPFSRITGMLVVPGEPGHLLVFANDGAALSEDRGAHWQVVTIPGISKSIYYMVTGGPNMPIYASGDGGTYVSTDGGNTFTLVNPNYYAYLTVSPVAPETLYGRTGVSIYRSDDGGKTWNALPKLPTAQSATNGRFESFTPDPTHVAVLYLLLSYPCGVVRYDQSSGQWTSLTPG